MTLSYATSFPDDILAFVLQMPSGKLYQANPLQLQHWNLDHLSCRKGSARGQVRLVQVIREVVGQCVLQLVLSTK